MRRYWRQLLVSVLLVSIVFSATRTVKSQADNTANPPRVIDTFPAEREVVTPASTLRFTFDQAMNRATVEAAFASTPHVDGKLNWADEATLTFTPAAPFQRGQDYTITIGTNAKATAGASLEDTFKLTFQVTANLGISQVIPAPDSSGVQAQSTITVVFNRPVVPLVTTSEQANLPQPLTFSPALEGTGEWVGTAIYTFHPKKALAGGTTYAATISGDLKDVDGNPLDKPYSWKFTTIAPQLQSISPGPNQPQVSLTAAIQVAFNQPMDHDSTAKAFTLRNTATGANVAGTITWAEDDTNFSFAPTSPLQLGTTYQVSILGSARSASGNATLTNPATQTFTTVPYPRVVNTVPANGSQVEAGGGVTIIFASPMDPKSFADKIHVTPKPDPMTVQTYEGSNQVYINFASLPATTYTVTLDAGSADPYGNQIKNAYTFSYTTLDVLPSLGIATKDVVAYTSAYRPDTTLIASGINIKQVSAGIAPISNADLLNMPWNYGYLDVYRYTPPPFSRTWTVPVSAKVNERVDIPLKLASDQGGQLPPGMYFFQMTSPEFSGINEPPFRNFVVVATASLTIKVSPDEVLVWATDLKTGAPVPSADVTLYNVAKMPVASGKTDANGLFRAKVNSNLSDYNASSYLAVLTGNGIFGFSFSRWSNEFQPYDFKAYPDYQPRHDVAYLYTDQPVYRPGHPVYFRGIIRNQNDVTFKVPANSSVIAHINDSQGKEVYKETLQVNSYGAFNGKYQPPDNAAVGPYSLWVEYNQQQFSLPFQVAEFRPPEFLVNTTASAPEVVAGDTIKVTIDSKFYFGGPVSGGKFTWVAVANQGYFNYTGQGNYDFSAYNQYVYNRQVASGQGTLDDQGQFVISVPADLGGVNVTQTFTIEATVTDISNQAISGRTNVTVHPAQVYVGLQPAAYVGQAGKPMNVNVIAVDWASAPQPGQTVTLKVTEQRWEQDQTSFEWSQKSIDVTQGTVTTDDKGKAVYTFTPPHAGIYQIEATMRDSRERIARSSTYVWVAGPEYVPWNRGGENHLTLVSDKKSYNPGDTASILIASPFPEPVKALVTVERAGIMQADVVTITGSYTYQLPLDVIHAPNVYVAVSLIRGSGTDNVTPEIRYGLLELPVFVKQQLKIKITPSTASAKPGDTVKFDVLVTDLDGKPVAAEVGLSLSDLANLSVGQDQSGAIFDRFWARRGLSIETSSPLSRLIDALTGKDAPLRQVARRLRGGEATPLGTATMAALATAMPPAVGAAQPASGLAADGGATNEAAATDKTKDQQQAPTPRTNFVDTPLWEPAVVTNSDGLASVSVTLPDNLTTWRLDARAISMDTFVGSTTFDLISTKPLLVRPSTPRFFVVGDESELAVVVNNNTGQDLSVKVSLDAKGVTLKADATQTVSIPKAGRTRIIWLATVQDVDNVDLTFSAVSGDFSDASKPDVGIGDQRLLPVYRYLAPDYVATAGTLTQPGSRVEAVRVPSATLAPTGNLTVRVSPSLAAATIDGLNYLRNYPYQCVEQTVSKFLPNIITYRALQKLNLDKPELRADLEAAAKYALNRLKLEQHDDGGWGWWPDDESSPLVTTYALLGLIEARAADLSVIAPNDLQDMIERALAFLQSTVTYAEDTTQGYLMNREAFVLYVMARADNPIVPMMDSLFQRREKMSLYARAFLAQGYALVGGDQNKTNVLLSDFQNKAVVSATGTHWEEDYWDWWNWGSDTRSTAIILDTLVKLTPQSELIPNVVRWLMVARRGDFWESTQETAWAVMGLTDWMVASGELKADYAFDIQVNGKSIGDGKANADTLRDTKTLQVSVADMLRDQANRIVIDHGDGPGVLYYTATLTVNQPVEMIKPTDRGFAFDRTYYVNGKPVTTAKVGDVITVALEITLNSDMYYVNINDPIPAGTELVDTSLQTTSQVGQAPDFSQENYDAFRGWGWWWFTHTELRTEKVFLSAQYLPRGTFRFVYQIRATSPGVYRVIPPNGQEFYFPEVFGRGAGSLFTVTE